MPGARRTEINELPSTACEHMIAGGYKTKKQARMRLQPATAPRGLNELIF